MNTSVSRITRVVDMLDEAYAGPCSIARDPRPSRKVVSTLQVSRFMARQVHDGSLATRPSGAPPSGQPTKFTGREAPGQVGLAECDLGQFEPGGRGAPRRPTMAAGIETRRRRSTVPTGMMLKKFQDCLAPRNKRSTRITKAPARSHHGRRASQRTFRFSHGRGHPRTATPSPFKLTLPPGRQV